MTVPETVFEAGTVLVERTVVEATYTVVVTVPSGTTTWTVPALDSDPVASVVVYITLPPLVTVVVTVAALGEP